MWYNQDIPRIHKTGKKREEYFMKRTKRGLAALVAVVLAASSLMTALPVSAQAQTQSAFASEFASPTGNQAKLKTRYWMPGAWAASSQAGLDEVRREIKELADAGYGGIELADVRSLTKSEQSTLEQGNENGSFLYGSKNWQLVLQTVLEAAKEYGLQVDLTLSAYWPVASNEITPNDDAAAKELTYGIQKVGPGESFNGTVDPVSVTNNFDVIENELQGIYAAKLDNEGTTKVIQGMFNSNPVDRVQYTLDYSTYQNLTDTQAVNKETAEVSYTNNTEDTYVLISVYSRGTGQNIDGSYQYMDYTETTEGTGKSCWVVDHLSKDGAQVITNYLDNTVFNDEIKQLLKEVGGYFFEDSLELKGLTPWSAHMLDEFQANSGYDVDDLLPFVMGLDKSENYSEKEAIFIVSDDEEKMVDRLRADYVDTLSDMIIQNRIETFSNWANETYGMGYRMQAYGGIVDSGKASAYIDIPEGEPLTFTNESDRYRVMAAGRDMGGKQLLSNEIGASFTYGSCYGYPYDDLLATMNKNMAAGVNQNMLHGYAYAFSPEAQWPGYHAFGTGTSGPWSSRMPSWNNISTVTGYINRTQYVLQQGVQKTDIAIYRQEYNASIWQNGVKEFYYDDDQLADAGYSYQFFSRGLFGLDSAKVSDGVLNPEGPGYKAMIIDNDANKLSDKINAIPAEVAQYLVEYAKAGLPLVFIGDMPSRSLYGEDADSAVTDAMAALKTMSNVVCVEDYDEVPAALAQLGVAPSASFDQPVENLETVHRSDSNADYYYFYNDNADTDLTVQVKLTGEGIPCLLDAWTGEITPLTEYSVTKDGFDVEVSVGARSTAIVGLASPAYFGVDAPETHVADATAKTSYENGTFTAKVSENGGYRVELADGTVYSGSVSDVPKAVTIDQWDLTVEKWTAGDNSTANPLDTKKTEIVVGSTAPLPWAQIDGLGADVSGVGRYSATFNLDYQGSGALGGVLTLTDVSDTYKITLNGHEINTCDQIDYKVDLGSYLMPGENTIEIEVSSLLSNAVGKSTPSGLMGEVTILPCVGVELVDANADKAILNKVIAYAQAQKESPSFDQVITDVQTSFSAALEAAEQVAENAAAAQPEVDAAWKTLMTEIHKLGFVQGDKTTLETLIAMADEFNGNIGWYTPSTAAPFAEALKAAKATYDDGNAMTDDVALAESTLFDAMVSLRYKADKSILEAVLADAAEIDLSQYTAQSVDAFKAAASDAKAVCADEDATQQDVDTATDRLRDAIDGLEAVPTAAETAAVPGVQGDAALTTGSGSAKTGEATAPIAAAAAALTLAAAAFALCGKKRR